MHDAHNDITVLLLDADGVIQRSGPEFVASLEALCSDPSQRSAFLSDIFAAEKPCLTGRGDFPAALERVLSQWRVEVSVSEALALWSQINPSREILGTVQSLRRNGIRVGLASNQQAHRADIMATRLGYDELFDDLFFSCQLGAVKPSSLFFTETLRRLQTAGKNVLFIDDHTENVAGARQVGICGALYHLDQGHGQFEAVLEGYNLIVGNDHLDAHTSGQCSRSPSDRSDTLT